jgi:hypothetical protein
MKGRLQWQNKKSMNKKEKYENIKNIKLKTPIEEICSELPNEFKVFLDYVKNLNFTEQPNYSNLKKLFTDLFKKMDYKRDYEYDWILITDQYKRLPPDFYKLKSDSHYTTSMDYIDQFDQVSHKVP